MHRVVGNRLFGLDAYNYVLHIYEAPQPRVDAFRAHTHIGHYDCFVGGLPYVSVPRNSYVSCIDTVCPAFVVVS